MEQDKKEHKPGAAYQGYVIDYQSYDGDECAEEERRKTERGRDH